MPMKIQRVQISDFLSVKQLDYHFNNGLHLFTGNNGAGKSSILLALQVGLFNKCERPQPWARLTGPGGFQIEVDFISVHGTEVKVINNRTKNRYEVFESGELLTYQISKGIPIVSKLLNLSYHEFTLLTFLTPSTVSNILTGTDSSLISKFFSLDILSEYDKVLREERKEITKDKKRLEGKLIESLEETKVYDIKTLEMKATGLRIRKLSAMSSQVVQEELPKLEIELLTISDVINYNTTKISDAQAQLLTLSNLGSTCELCGHDLDTDTTAKLRSINTLRDNISLFEKELKENNARYTKISTQVRAIREPHILEVAALEENLRQIEGELIAASILSERDTVDTSRLNEELSEIEKKAYALNLAIESIKSGDVHKAYLETFTSVLNNKLGLLKEDLSLSMRIIAKISSNGLSFNVLEDGMYKSADILSAGEKVIVGLLVLSAMFDTLEDTLDINISTIILDEAVGAVSTENMPIVEKVIRSISATRCVILTQHHEELSEDIFDTVSEIIKMDGITERIER